MTKIFLFVQLRISKSAVGVYDEAPEPEIIEVPASSSSYLFKNLFGSTSYSLTVWARNDAGRGVVHIEPFTKKTEPGKSEEYGRAWLVSFVRSGSLKQFPNDSTNTKVVTLTNHSRSKLCDKPIRIPIKYYL